MVHFKCIITNVFQTTNNDTYRFETYPSAKSCHFTRKLKLFSIPQNLITKT